MENKLTEFEKEMEARLLSAREELTKKLASNTQQIRSDNNGGPLKDSIDQVSADLALLKAEALSKHDSNQLKAIDSALARLRTGSFGNCLKCGKKISEARLRAIPWAILCIDCKNADEERKKS